MPISTVNQIKSIQRVLVTALNMVNPQNLTISEVDINKSSIDVLGFSTDSSGLTTATAYLELTSPTNVRMSRAEPQKQVDISIQITEYQ